MNRFLIPLFAIFCGAASAQTLSVISGNGQLEPANLGDTSSPIIVKLTNSAGAPIVGQVVTFTSSNGGIPLLSASAVATDANGEVTVVFYPGILNQSINFITYQYQATASGAKPAAFSETTYYVSSTQQSYVAANITTSPNILTPYISVAGKAGAGITVQVESVFGTNGGVAVVGTSMHPILVAPVGNPAQTVKCAEATDAEGNVFTNSSGFATCSLVFGYPNLAYPVATNSFEYQIVVGESHTYGPFTYNVSAAPLALTQGPILAVYPWATPPVIGASGGVPPYTYSLTSTSGLLPSGLSLQTNTNPAQPNTDIIAGTTTDAPKVYPFSVQVTDKLGAVAIGNFSVAVNGGPFSLSGYPTLPLIVGVPFSGTVAVTGGVPPYTNLAVSNLPPGLKATANAAGDTAIVITGTPTAPALTGPPVVTGKDALGTPITLNLPITAVTALVVTPVASPVVVALHTQVTGTPIPVSGGAAPYSYTTTGFPAGITLTPNGAVTGTATGPAGEYPVTVTVSDQSGQSKMISFTLDVAGGTIMNSISTLPPATAGALYSNQLAISGGVPPYVYSVPTGSMVTVSSTGLLSGTFTLAGTQQVNISVTDALGNTQVVPLSVTVLPGVGGVTNAATFVAGAIAPGEIISIFGSGIGPATGVGSVLGADGLLPTTVGGTQVLIGGLPAPILYASSTQLNVIVPFSLSTTQPGPITVTSNGQTSAALTVTPAVASPGVFVIPNTTNATQAAALNQDLSVNNATNPAAVGSVVVLYATGGGVLSGSIQDGALAGTNPLITIADVTLTIGGAPATVQFAGLAPGLAGVVQVNAVIPTTVGPNNAVPVVLTIAGVPSAATTQPTIAVKAAPAS